MTALTQEVKLGPAFKQLSENLAPETSSAAQGILGALLEMRERLSRNLEGWAAAKIAARL
jgi:hypothetical protein